MPKKLYVSKLSSSVGFTQTIFVTDVILLAKAIEMQLVSSCKFFDANSEMLFYDKCQRTRAMRGTSRTHQ